MRPLPPQETSSSTKKTPWCSVIIPVLNEAAILKSHLSGLIATLPKTGVELLLVDGGSQDDSVLIAKSLGCRVLNAPRGRARQLNAGAREARGELLYFLHLDTLPPARWIEFLEHARKEGTLPLTFRVRFTDQHQSWLLQFFSWCSRFDLEAFRFGDQSLLVHRNDFRAVGGFREDFTLLEGNDLVRRLRRHTGQLTVHPQAVTTSSRRYLDHGILFTQAIFALIYLAYRLGLPHGRLVALHNWAFGGTS